MLLEEQIAYLIYESMECVCSQYDANDYDPTDLKPLAREYAKRIIKLICPI